jgi:hypothetical protein
MERERIVRKVARTGKSKRETLEKIIVWTILVLGLIRFLWPRSFHSILPGLDPSRVTRCEVDLFSSGTENGEAFSDIQKRSFAPDSQDYRELLELLSSTSYRWQFSNYFGGGSSGYSVDLNPFAEISFYQGNQCYEYNLLGADVPAGPTGDTDDYSPWGGREFQKRVVAYLGEHGQLIEQSSP